MIERQGDINQTINCSENASKLQSKCHYTTSFSRFAYSIIKLLQMGHSIQKGGVVTSWQFVIGVGREGLGHAGMQLQFFSLVT